MKTTTAPFNSPALLTPARTLQFKVGGTPVRLDWSTPTQWWVMLGVTLLTGFLFVLAVSNAMEQKKGAFKSVVTDCAPSIVAAEHIRASLADLDANLTNELLCKPGSPDMARAVESVRGRRHEFTENLLLAAANITFGDDERLPLTRITDEIGTYEAAMARARAYQEKGDPAVVAVSREASRLMHETILPAADAIKEVNSQVLDRTYAAQQRKSLYERMWVALTGLCYLAALAGSQWLLWRTTRRRLNPGLFLASTLVVCFTLYGAVVSLRSSRLLREATKDAFDSVRFLWNARAIAFDANGAESRWLYDRLQASVAEREFFLKTNQVAQAPQGIRLQSVASSALAHPERPQTPGFEGLLARELGNITYEGELAAAAAAIETFGDYREVDAKIRALEKGDHHDQAVALCLSYGPGGSNAAFDEFDQALDKVLEINARAFARLGAQGVNGLNTFSWFIPAFGLVAAVCVFAGFWPRIKEYSA